MPHSITLLRLALVALLHGLCASAFAMPAQPGTRLVTLPDGTQRTVIVRGDERCHWLCDTHGREISGTRTTSQRLAAPLGTLPPTLRRAPAKPGSMLLEGSFPTTGKRRLLALLVNFANTTPTYSSEQYDRMLNEEGYNGVGSFRDYYLDQSYGQLDIHTTVTPWITVAQPKQYYNIDNTPSLIEEALKQIDGTVDLRDYDNDHDGILDGLIVIHAGEGQEATGNATDIWSHSSTIYGMQFDGVSVFRYTIEPECLGAHPSTIGVFCHEFGHNLGALDYYDTNYSSDGAYGGTGPWDIMGEGAWNGSGGQGTHPAPFTAWQKWQFGWSTPTPLTASQHISAMPASALDGLSYIMETTTEGDYFVIENVQNVSPWTSDLPGHGLIVTHVIESIVSQRMAMNTINASYPQGIYTVSADAHSDPIAGDPRSYGDLTSSAAPFPGTRLHTAFTDETLPSTHSHDGRYGYIGLQSISETDGTINFDFIQGDAPQRPIDLSATVAMGLVRLEWTFPADKEQPNVCHVYRAGNLVATIAPSATPPSSRWTYSDSDCTASGKVRYTVDATYASGLTSAITSVETRIPAQVATHLDATLRTDDAADHGVIDLAWDLPATLSRCTDDLHYELVDHHAATFCYAHRFRADDLLPHIGRQIKSISFIPQQRSTDASYKILVWRTPAVEGQPSPTTLNSASLEVVAERAVTEFSPSYQRAVPFVSRPTIERGYDYLVGVEITSKSGLAEAVTDQAELQDGYGNLMCINGGGWTTDPAAKGNYIITTTLTGDVQPSDLSTLIIDVLGSTSSHGTLFDTYWCPFDVDADLFLPLGFTVFADGTRVAETTAHSVTIPLDYRRLAAPDADGYTTLSLCSTYKGGNYSREVSARLFVGDAYAGATPVELPASSVPVYDLTGRRVAVPTHGLYVEGGRKVMLR